MKETIYILNFIFFIISSLFAYNQPNYLKKHFSTVDFMNYSINSDSLISDTTTVDSVVSKFGKKQFVAMAMSAIIPGTGQIYNGNWKRGVAYLGIELLLWSYRENYNGKGDHYVNLYKDFANKHWSFSNWIENYHSFMDPSDPVNVAMVNHQDCIQSGPFNGGDNGYNGYCAPWYQAHYIEWTDANGNLNTSKNSSSMHDYFVQKCGPNYYMNGCALQDNSIDQNITLTRDHHFYEGIGKYNLFYAGWIDVDSDQDACLTLNYGNIVRSGSGCRWIEEKNGYPVALSNYKKYYQDVLRAKSNDKYDYAENALTAIFINHAVSMLDGLFSDLFKKRKQRLNFSTVPIYDLNYNMGINGIKLNLKW